jgi:hypothetical protein
VTLAKRHVHVDETRIDRSSTECTCRRVCPNSLHRAARPWWHALPALPRGTMRSRLTTVVVFVSATLLGVQAHPVLYDRVGSCVAAHHPTVKRHGHGSSSVDDSIGFKMAWSAPDGSDEAQANENDPMRAIPGSWEIATNEFKPGCRHTLTVVNPSVGEMMVTASFGVFAEFGLNLDGKTNYGRGVACGGRRYDTASGFKKPNTRFVWVAPSVAELNITDGGVVFKVTTASGSRDSFRNNQVSFFANEQLPVPIAGAAAATPPPGSQDVDNAGHAPVSVYGLQPLVAAHGFFMTLGWAVLVPIGVWFARHGKPLPGVGGFSSSDGSMYSSNYVSRATQYIRHDGRWLKVHRFLTAAGLCCALLGSVLIYAEVNANAGGEHFRSKHALFGTSALVLGFAQPLNAFFRPNAPTQVTHGASVGKTVRRKAWEIGHRCSGAAGLVCSVVAVLSGIDRAQVWGEAPATARSGKHMYVAWLAFVCLATAGLEFARYREQKQAHAHEELKEVEMGDA